MDITSKLRGIWITPMGLGSTRTGNVRYTKQLWNHIRKSHSLDLVYYQYKNTIDRDVADLKLLFKNVYPIVQPSIHFKVRAGEDYLWSINDFVSQELLEWCSKNITPNRYDFVVCDYVYMTPALDAINDSVVKILNSHDQMGDKHIKMKYSNELIKKTFSITKAEELSAIEKCDIVMCITDEEKSYFDSFLFDSLFGNFINTETILIQHLPNNIRDIKKNTTERKNIINLGFMGSSNIVNVEGLNKFLNYFQDLKSKNINLILAGKICETVTNVSPNVILMGEVTDEKDFYGKIDIIVNPMPKGTSGLKIKTIDAFAYSLPIIGTKDAFLGIDTSSKWHSFDDIKSLSNNLVRIFDSEHIISEIDVDTKYAAHKYWRKVESQLDFLFTKIRNFKSNPKNKSQIWIQNNRHNYDLKIARLNERYSRKIQNLPKENKKYQDQSRANYHKYLKSESRLKEITLENDFFNKENERFKEQSKINYDKYLKSESRLKEITLENDFLNKENKRFKEQSKINYHKYLESESKNKELIKENKNFFNQLKKEISLLKDDINLRLNSHQTKLGINDFSIESFKKKIGLAIDSNDNNLINFIPIIKSRYLREYSHVKLYLSSIPNYKSRFFSCNDNIELLTNFSSNLKIHKITIPEIVNHSSWRQTDYLRNEINELDAFNRFKKRFGKDYILINHDNSYINQLSKNLLNINLNQIDSLLKIVVLDKKNLYQNGLGDIKFIDLRKIIENAKYLHFSNSFFSDFADMCDLSSHYQIPTLHLYQNSENNKNDLNTKIIKGFIKNKQWFKSKWKIYFDRNGNEFSI